MHIYIVLLYMYQTVCIDNAMGATPIPTITVLQAIIQAAYMMHGATHIPSIPVI